MPVAVDSFLTLIVRHVKECLILTDYVPPEDWGPEYPIAGAVRHNIPMPTLYNAEGKWLHVYILNLHIRHTNKNQSACAQGQFT